MRSSRLTLASPMAVASLAALGSAMPIPRKGSNRHTERLPEVDLLPLARLAARSPEIAAWNAVVDAKKAAKKAAKKGATHG